jgi:branched-chain amino acid transport system substrate-binding protein
MRSNRLLAGLWLFVFSVGILGSLPALASEPLVIGVVHREDFAYAKMMRQAYDMAVAEINRKGGVKGRPLKLVFADDRGDRYIGPKAIAELIDAHKVTMLIGGYSSSNVLEMARIADAKDRPFLVSTAADDRITQRQLKNIYRLNPPASEYARALEDFFLNHLKPASMSIIYENSPFGTGGALRMMWFCRENDIAINAIIPYHKERASETYFIKLISQVQKDPPQIIYMVSYLKDASILVKTLKAQQIPSLLSGGAGGFTHADFISRTGAAAEKLITATLWSPELDYPGARDFYHKFKAQHAIPPDYHGAEAYSAVLVAADVLRRSASLSAADIRQALDATDMITPFGPVRFTAYGRFERQNSPPTQVMQIINADFRTVWPSNLATAYFDGSD